MCSEENLADPFTKNLGNGELHFVTAGCVYHEQVSDNLISHFQFHSSLSFHIIEEGYQWVADR